MESNINIEVWADGTTAVYVDGERVFTGDHRDALDIVDNLNEDGPKDRTLTLTEDEYQMVLDALALAWEDYFDQADAFDRMQNEAEGDAMRHAGAKYGLLYDRLNAKEVK